MFPFCLCNVEWKWFLWEIRIHHCNHSGPLSVGSIQAVRHATEGHTRQTYVDAHPFTGIDLPRLHPHTS